MNWVNRKELQKHMWKISSAVLIIYLAICGFALWSIVRSANTQNSYDLMSLVFIALLNICLLLVFEMIAIKKIQYPLARITVAAEQIAKGDLETDIGHHGDDETARLADAINQLRNSMLQSQEEIKNYVKELESRITELDFLTTIDSAILSGKDSDSIFELITERVAQLMGSDFCCVALQDKENHIRIKSLHGFNTSESKELISQLRKSVKESLICPAMVNGEITPIDNVDNSKLDEELKNIFLMLGAKAMIAAPLSIDDHAIGSLVVWFKEAQSFSNISVNRFKLFADQVAVLVHSARLVDGLRNMTIDIIRSLANAVDARDSYTANHSNRVSRFAVALAQELGLSNEQVQLIEFAGLMHDIGKIGIAEEILNKPDALSREEMEIMKNHASISAAIIGPIEPLSEIIPIVQYHHEWYNGNGYPEGLSGSAIPLGSRILAVADALEAMTSNRPYRKEMSLLEGARRLAAGAGVQFDPRIVEAMLRVVEKIESVASLERYSVETIDPEEPGLKEIV